MARMMDLFEEEFLRFQEKCDAMELTVDVRYNEYPPRVVLRQEQNLFDATGTEEQRETEVVILGKVEPEIVVKGSLEVTKKQLNDLIRGATELLKIYLHAYMQDRMEYERGRLAQK